MAADPSNAPILIVGCARSGTTIFRDLLRSHSRISIPPESLVLTRLLRVHGDPVDSAAARRLAASLLGGTSIRTWGLGMTPADLEHRRSFSAMVADVYAAWARSEGKRRWGDKTPAYTEELPALRRIFPGGQVIHVIRDPRSVTASLTRVVWGPRSVRGAAVRWRTTVEAARRDGAALGPGLYREVRHEDLVQEPERVLREVCDFLGEEFEPGMLRPNRIRLRLGGGRKDPDVLVAGPAPNDVLGSRDRAIVAWEAGDLAEELGYGALGPRKPPFPGEYALRRTVDRAAMLRWRLTETERGPRIRESLRIARTRLRAALTRSGVRASG